MIRPNDSCQLHTYHVTLGHQTVAVQAADEERAIEIARQQLSLDLPRLWDVIHTLDRCRFLVRMVTA